VKEAPTFYAHGRITRITEPLVIMFVNEDEGATCHIHPSRHWDSPDAYGLLVADLIRQIAHAFDVSEEDIWEDAGRELRNPTTTIIYPS